MNPKNKRTLFLTSTICIILSIVAFALSHMGGASNENYIRSNGHHDLFGDEVNCPQQELWWRNGYFFECHFEIFLNKGKECYVTNQELIQKLRCEKGYKQP